MTFETCSWDPKYILILTSISRQHLTRKTANLLTITTQLNDNKYNK